MSEERIKVPQYQANQRQQERRREAVEEVKAALADEQRRVLDEDPSGAFKHRMPLEARQHFSGGEIAEIEAAEEIAYSRHQQQAQAKEHKRRMWTAVGGDPGQFEEDWEVFGEEAYMRRRAEEAEQRVTSPY